MSTNAVAGGVEELDRFIRELERPPSPWDLSALGLSLLLAYGLCWLLTRRQRPSPDSVWFGRMVFDGLLFPLLALAFAQGARLLLEPGQPLPFLRLAVPVLLSLAGVRLLARVFTKVFPQSMLARLVERVISWFAWLAAALWILGLLPRVLDWMAGFNLVLGQGQVSLLGLLRGLLWSGMVLVLVLWISSTVERRILQDAVTDLSLRKAAANAIRATLLLLGLLVALSAAGVDLTALSLISSALVVGLGFGLRQLAANYVSGFVLLSERSLRIGDTVKVDDIEGVVLDIKTRYTLIRSGNGRQSIVPNERLTTQRIENLSVRDPRLMISVEVLVAYDSDVDQVQQLLLEAASGCELVLDDPAPACRLMRFAPEGLEFHLNAWVAEAVLQVRARSELNLAVFRKLRAAGVRIAQGVRVVELRGAQQGAAAPPPAN